MNFALNQGTVNQRAVNLGLLYFENEKSDIIDVIHMIYY